MPITSSDSLRFKIFGAIRPEVTLAHPFKNAKEGGVVLIGRTLTESTLESRFLSKHCDLPSSDKKAATGT